MAPVYHDIWVAGNARARLYYNFSEVTNTWGDALIACFRDPVEAFHCAATLAAHLEVDNLPARIGMADGEVSISPNTATGRQDISGKCGNVAARLEQIAEAYEVLISADFCDYAELKSTDFIFSPVKRPLKKGYNNKKAGDLIDCCSVRKKEKGRAS